MKQFKLISNAHFKIGGKDLVASLHSEYLEEPEKEEEKKKLKIAWEQFLADLNTRTSALLKTDTVSFLLGAGASKECGGPLINSIPLDLEKKLFDAGISGKSIRSWLKCFFLAVQNLAGNNSEIPSNRDEIIKRKTDIETNKAKALDVNFEMLLSLLYKWRKAIHPEGGRLRLNGNYSSVDLHAETIEECLHQATSALVSLCQLPIQNIDAKSFKAFENLLRKILTRPLNLKRANIFTLNYDTLVEQAADAQGIVLIDGFIGSVKRKFRPESFDQDLYFPTETTEGRIHRFDKVLHLYKVHGSINWTLEKSSWENPYGICSHPEGISNDKPALIYPTPAKWDEALGMPYAELIRRFATKVVRPQSVLFVIGYGFGDEHIRAIVRQALTIPSFTLVVIDPEPKSEFVKNLKTQDDRRIWIFEGETLGKFSGFVQHALADLQDENINRKIMETHRALKKNELSDVDGEKTNA